MKNYSARQVDGSGRYARVIYRGSHPQGVALNEPYLDSDSLEKSLSEVNLFPVLIVLETNGVRKYIELRKPEFQLNPV